MTPPLEKRSNRFIFSSLLVLGTFLGNLFIPLTTYQAEAAVSDWQKGISMYPVSTTDFGSNSFEQSITNAHNAGANTVAFIVPMYQNNLTASDIFTGWNTPSDSSLISGINYAHSLGMKTILKLHVDSYTGEWRANIDASNRDAWYSNYGNILNHLGDIGKQTGAEGIVIGTEMINMADYNRNSDNTERWNVLISNLRQHFSGFLTYSANWGGNDFAEEAPHIGFWSSLDFIGISAYYPLAEGQSNPSEDALTGSWSYWDTNKIQSLHDQYNKPILFTEIGYRSVDDAHSSPWNSGPGGNYNGNEQSNDYQSLFTYWNNRPYISGIYIWNWDTDPNLGGSGNTDFTPHDKPAQDILSTWFGGSSNGDSGNTGGGSSTSGNWNISATIPSLTANQNSTIPLDVSITDKATNVIIDAEIYNSSGQQISQQFFTSQNITSSPINLNISWTPPSNGSYTLKTGVFNSDWSQLFNWSDSVATMSVGNNSDGGGSDNSGSVAMDIWWPTDGTTISEVQPFKSLIENRSLSDYRIYWQVDGGSLVEMTDNQSDFPHKESDVNVNPWNWNGDGPYSITFVAKDNDGNIISQKAMNIYVAHW